MINDLQVRHGYKYHLDYLSNNNIKSFTIYFFLKIIDLANSKSIINTYKFNFNPSEDDTRLNIVDNESFGYFNQLRKDHKLICNEINCYQEHYIFNDNYKREKIIINSANQINKFYREVSNDGKKFILIIHPSARNFYTTETHINYNNLDKTLIKLIDKKVEIINLKDEFDKEFKGNYKNIFYKFDGHYNLAGYKLTSEIISKKLKEFLD